RNRCRYVPTRVTPTSHAAAGLATRQLTTTQRRDHRPTQPHVRRPTRQRVPQPTRPRVPPPTRPHGRLLAQQFGRQPATLGRRPEAGLRGRCTQLPRWSAASTLPTPPSVPATVGSTSEGAAGNRCSPQARAWWSTRTSWQGEESS